MPFPSSSSTGILQRLIIIFTAAARVCGGQKSDASPKWFSASVQLLTVFRSTLAEYA